MVITLKLKIWKILGLISIMVFMLSTTASVHAASLTTTIPVGSQPVGVAYDPSMHEIFVANYLSGDIQVISDSTNAVVADITALSQYAGAPYDLAYDSAKGEMWVTDATGAYAISDATNTIVANVTNGIVPGWGGLTRIAYDSGKGELFVSYTIYDEPSLNLVQVISDSTNTIVANITISAYAMVYDPAKGEIFASEESSDVGNQDIAVISDTTNAIIATIPVGADFLAYDSAKGEIFAESAGTGVYVISDSSNKVIATINDESFWWEGTLAYDSAKGEIFLNGHNEVDVISDNTNKVIGSVSTNFSYPTDIAYDSGTGQLYAANSGIPGTIVVISDSSSGTSSSTSTPSSTTSAGATSTPKVPEFSSAALVSVGIALIALTVSAVALKARTRKSPRT